MFLKKKKHFLRAVDYDNTFCRFLKCRSWSQGWRLGGDHMCHITPKHKEQNPTEAKIPVIYNSSESKKKNANALNPYFFSTQSYRVLEHTSL